MYNLFLEENYIWILYIDVSDLEVEEINFICIPKEQQDKIQNLKADGFKNKEKYYLAMYRLLE